MSIRQHIWTLILILLLVTACARQSDEGGPSVKILSPVVRTTIPLGETLEIQARVKDSGGLDRVELLVNGTLAHTVEVPSGQKSYVAVHTWSPPNLGAYFVTVIAYNKAGQASEPAGVTITVNPPPTPPSDAPPSALPSPSSSGATSITGTDSDDCAYNATFLSDVTIPDNTQLAPGTEFDKTWRLRNSSACDWGQGFQLVFVEGEQMGNFIAVPVPPTKTGEDVEVTVRLKAPQQAGDYRGRWRMRTAGGHEFGDRFFVQVVVRDAP